MANFPTDWEVHSDEKFNMFDMDATFDTALGMNTLLKVGADGRSTGIYKLYLFGGGTMESRYKNWRTSSTIFPTCLKDFT
jgi:hypothetical protein